jgi:hypothetical protein
MDSAEIIKAAPEIAKVVGPVAVAIPFTSIVKKMLGPAADELAEMWRDQVRLYRYGRQVKCIEKAEKMAKEAGFTPKAVPIKLLFPLLEGASLEEDETLHDMWAALLANASSPEHSANVRPGFIAILKQMAPDEAALLKTVEELTDGHFTLLRPQSFRSKAALDRAVGAHNAIHMTRICESFAKREGEEKDETSSRLETCILILENMGLVDYQDVVLLTAMGGTFFNACRPPKPKP